MHVSFRNILVGLHLLCLITLGGSNRKRPDKEMENEISEKTRVITVKFPEIKVSVDVAKRTPTARKRRLHIDVQPAPENCKAQAFRSEFRQLRQKIECEPRDTVVELTPPAGASLTPNAVIVKRCGGMCHGHKRCLSVEQKDVKFFVKEVKNNQLHCSSIFVTEDTKCKCGCLQKSEHCKKTQMYVKEKCACVCKNEKDYTVCVENQIRNENLYWDEESCSCLCQQNRSCTTGTYWVERECRCVKIFT